MTRRQARSTRRKPRLGVRLPASKARLLRRVHLRTDDTQTKLFRLYLEITDSIRDELRQIDPEKNRYELLSPVRGTVILIDDLEAEVNNGGFAQYYGNSSGDGAALVPAALRRVGQHTVAKLVERANSQFEEGPPRSRARREAALDRLSSKARRAWERADARFYNLPSRYNSFGLMAVVPFILEHESEFFRRK